MNEARPMINIPENRTRFNPKINSDLLYDIEQFEMDDLDNKWSCIIADGSLLTGDIFSKERYYKKSVYEFLEKLFSLQCNFREWNVIKYKDIVGLNICENRKILLYHKETWNDGMRCFDKTIILDLNK